MARFGWDKKKAAANLKKHRVAFEAAERFDFDTAFDTVDDDLAYGEERRKAYGFIGSVLHVMIYTERGDVIWVISLREAIKKEKRDYEQAIEAGW